MEKEEALALQAKLAQGSSALMHRYIDDSTRSLQPGFCSSVSPRSYAVAVWCDDGQSVHGDRRRRSLRSTAGHGGHQIGNEEDQQSAPQTLFTNTPHHQQRMPSRPCPPSCASHPLPCLSLPPLCSSPAIKYIPSVIEPSFGIGRILYHLLEHAFRVRPNTEAAASTTAAAPTSATPDTKMLRAYLSLPPHMAPVKVAILPLSGQPQFVPLSTRLLRLFTAANLSSKADSSGNSIGRRYARCDEVGIPFALTIDFDSVKDNTVTLRERDSTQQVRLHVNEVVDVVTRLCREIVGGEDEGETEEEKSMQQRRYITWAQVYSTYPQVIRSDADDN